MVKTTNKTIMLMFALFFFVFAGVINAQTTDKPPCAATCSKSSTCIDVETDCSGDHEHGTEVKATSKKAMPWNSVCPVSGNSVDSKVKTIEYQGKVYGFCSTTSMDKFKKDPSNYYSKLKDDGKSLKNK
jgi:YHS domain-containing protein